MYDCRIYLQCMISIFWFDSENGFDLKVYQYMISFFRFNYENDFEFF